MAFDKGSWKPNPKQELFLALPWSIKEANYGGGAGSGKSDVLLVYPLVHKLHENPRFKQVFLRRTYPELKNEIIPRSREIYSKFGATFNRTDMAWTFPRADQLGSGSKNQGAMIFLGHCEHEDDVHRYDSMEINLFTPDELTSFTEYIYLYIGFTRTRTSDSTLPAIIRSAGMPGGIGHTFVRKRFVDPYPKGGKVIVGKGGNKRVYIHSTWEDNKEHIDPNYAQSLEALPEAEKRAKKYGDWSAYLGQVFSEFRDKRYPDEPENALHVVQPFEIPKFWPRIIIGDWGFRAMTYIMYGAISPSKRIYIYREQHWTQTRIEEWAPNVKYYIDKEQPKVVKFCRSAAQDRGQEHTIEEQINNALGISIELVSGNQGSRVAGKTLIHEYLRFKQKEIPKGDLLTYSEEYAAWVLRNRGLEGYKAYLAKFNPTEEENNLPKLQIFYDPETKVGCPTLIEAIKACSYDKPKDNKPAEDVAEFDGDDPYDALRYMIDTADKYFDEAEREFARLKTEDALVQKLQETQDYTAYYRNMRTMEASVKVKPVRMYHRR